MQYQFGEKNHCPGCGRSQWIVGRVTAECAFCATALPLAESRDQSQRVISFGKGGGKVSRMLAMGPAQSTLGGMSEEGRALLGIV